MSIRKRIGMSVGILFLFLAMIGCSNGKQPAGEKNTATNLLNAKWQDVEAEAKGQTVNMYMWGGSESINRYIDEWVAPRLKEKDGIVLHRVPVNDTKDVMNQLSAEKQAGKTDGSVDVVWMNGENFKLAKDQQLLWGSFAEKLPNYNQFVDKSDPVIASDFGLATEGLEAPWGKAQFVFVYDSSKIQQPPKSMEELKDWVKQHPGKFTYPAPPDFTGSAFVRQALFETTGGYEQYLKPLDPAAVGPKLTSLWSYLNELKPNLWRQGTTYPESLAKLDQLYANGEVWMTMGYDPARAAGEIKKGTFPPTTRTFVLSKGTLSNTHYLSIPFNSKHQAGAMVTINFLESPEAQMAKLNPANWGDDMSIDVKKLSAEDQKKVSAIDRGVATLPEKELTAHQIPEIPADYVDFLEKSWLEHVAKK